MNSRAMQMDALVSKMAAVNLQDIALAIFLVISMIGALAHRSLANALRSSEDAGWKSAGSLDAFKGESMADEVTFIWNIVSRKYRASQIRKIRMLGDLNLACFVAMWIIALAVIMFGDLGRYDKLFNFRSGG